MSGNRQWYTVASSNSSHFKRYFYDAQDVVANASDRERLAVCLQDFSAELVGVVSRWKNGKYERSTLDASDTSNGMRKEQTPFKETSQFWDESLSDTCMLKNYQAKIWVYPGHKYPTSDYRFPFHMVGNSLERSDSKVLDRLDVLASVHINFICKNQNYCQVNTEASEHPSLIWLNLGQITEMQALKSDEEIKRYGKRKVQFLYLNLVTLMQKK